MVIFDLKEYAKNNNIKITGKRLKEDIFKAILDAKYNVDSQKYKGKGLKKVIYGKGYSSSDEDEQPVRKNTVLKKVIIITISYMLIKANTLAVLTSNPPIEASESKS